MFAWNNVGKCTKKVLQFVVWMTQSLSGWLFGTIFCSSLLLISFVFRILSRLKIINNNNKFQKVPKRVNALILSNSFCSTKYFEKNPPLGGFASILPEFVLKLSKNTSLVLCILFFFKKNVLIDRTELLEALPTKELDDDERAVIDFLVRIIESLSRDVILSRMRLMCDKDSLSVDEIRVPKQNIALISVCWICCYLAFSQNIKQIKQMI